MSSSRPSGWREAASALGRDPGEGWREHVLHHGLRVAAVLVIAALIPLLFPRTPLPDFALLEEGMVAPEDVIARIGFAVPKASGQLEAERREAERAVAPIFELDPSAADSAIGRVDGFFARLDSVLSAPDAADRRGVDSLLSAYSIPVDSAQVAWLRPAANRRRLEDALLTAYRRALPAGVARGSDLSGIRGGRILVRGPEGDRLLRADSVVTAGRFFELASRSAPPGAPAAGIHLFQTLLVRFNEPSLRPDPAATRAAQHQARSVVDTIAGYVLEGERIVSAHERVTPREIDRLRAYQEELVSRGLAGGGGLLRSLGAGLYSALLLTILAVALRLFRPDIYRQPAGYLIVMSLVLLVMGAASAIWRGGAPAALIPIAFIGVLLGALYDGLIALVAVLVTAALLGGQGPFAGLGVPFALAAAGATSALGVRGVHRRTQGWWLIAGITGAYALAGAAMVTMRSLPVGDLIGTTLWGGVSATLCTVLGIQAVLPALEKLTGITTDQTLLELSDLNAPLLRELSRRAPGTYAHSINVANLAETACPSLGVSPLLVRVGAYYHDIGKMLQPEYFVENQPKGRNPHDRIPPARSARIIRDHVREGLRLAAEHRLPPVIRDFIREHHGTQLIAYFWERARADEDGELDPRDFAYPGPKPRTKASGLLMLADSVESSSRVLQDPTSDRIRGLIDRIIRLKAEERQLDDCPLTLRDLEQIRSHFARVLIGLYHRRIEYPSAERPAGDGEPRRSRLETQGGRGGEPLRPAAAEAARAAVERGTPGPAGRGAAADEPPPTGVPPDLA